VLLCSFVPRGGAADGSKPGVVKGGKIFEIAGHPSIIELLRSGDDPSRARLSSEWLDLGSIKMLAPVPRPGKIVATIVNTQGMLGGDDVGLDRPRLDMKAPSAVIGPEEEIKAPRAGVRPEVELAAIVGKRMSKATESEAEEAIAGYTVLNDVTAPADSRDDAYEAYRRDKATGQIRKTTLRGPLFRSKNHDTFCPMGPWIATPDENEDWTNLRMTTKFGAFVVQDGSTSEYLFGPARIASYVSQFLTLEAGDVVSCGSVGWTREALGRLDPTEFVLPARSDVLELEIQGVGKLRNPVTFA